MISLWRRPILERVAHLHAPVALPPTSAGGRTPLHIVARGRGWLSVRDATRRRLLWRRFCIDGFDGVVHVDVAARLSVTFRSLVASATVDIALAVLAHAPAPVPPPSLDAAAIALSPRLTIPDLRPPAVRPVLPGAP